MPVVEKGEGQQEEEEAQPGQQHGQPGGALRLGQIRLIQHFIYSMSSIRVMAQCLQLNNDKNSSSILKRLQCLSTW